MAMGFVRQRGSQRKPEAIFASQVMRQLRILYGSRLWETAFPGGLGSRSGIPDRLICLDGRFLALEFKSPNGTGRLGPKQKLELEALDKAGAFTLIVSSPKDLEPLFLAFPTLQKRISDAETIRGEGLSIKTLKNAK